MDVFMKQRPSPCDYARHNSGHGKYNIYNTEYINKWTKTNKNTYSSYLNVIPYYWLTIWNIPRVYPVIGVNDLGMLSSSITYIMFLSY